MATLSLAEVQREVEQLALPLGPDRKYLPHFGQSDGAATPHIEVYGGAYHYVVEERGVELSRETTPDLDRLLELAFVDMTSAMANHYELHHRVLGQGPATPLIRPPRGAHGSPFARLGRAAGPVPPQAADGLPF